MNIYDQIAQNRRSTWFLISAFIIFFLVIGMGADYYYGAGFKTPFFTIIAFVIAALVSYSSYMYGDRLVISSAHARQLDLNEPKQREWHNVVEEMSIAAGIPVPRIYVIDDPDPNAFATGRNPQHSSIVVTRGLVDTLSRDELQAVASHEMSHIKNYDIRLMLVISVLIGSIALVSDWAGRGFLWGRRRDERGAKAEGGAALVVLAVWLVAVILAPLISHIIAMFVSRRREYLADASGAELTRNPMALASALEKISAHAGPTRSINRGTAHLCIEDPQGRPLDSKEGWVADLFATHPPVRKRIEALRRMAYI